MASDRISRTHLLAISASVGLLLAGCSGGAQRAPVEGTVVDKGQPVAGIQVIFEPLEGQPGDMATGITDAAGRYSLADPAGGSPGAIVGSNRVSLSVFQEDPGDELTPLPRRNIPLRFRDGSTIVEVSPEGTGEADFAL